MKSRRGPHEVALSRQALAIIESLRPLTGDSPHLFPNRRDRIRPMGTSTLQRVLENLGVDVSPHGFRHTASTRLHEMGFDTLAIEAALAHSDSNRIRARYNRSTFEATRRRMMQAWADWLDALKAGREPGASNVIALRAATAE
jgi:integrase